MRRLAALYDIHANLRALDAVLDEVEQDGFEAVVIGGDVLPGPQPRECLARLRDLRLPVHYLRGNGDRETLAAAEGRETATLPEAARAILRDNARLLSPEDKAWIAAWPPAVRLTLDGVGEVLFCHATPASDHETLANDCSDAELARAFGGTGAALVVCGHTHIQFDRTTAAGVRVVNAGSVGMPFQAPGAYWLELGPWRQGLSCPSGMGQDSGKGREASGARPQPDPARTKRGAAYRPAPLLRLRRTAVV